MTEIVNIDNQVINSDELGFLLNKLNSLKQELVYLTELIENLQNELNIIKQEYNTKFSALYIRIDELDIELAKTIKIKELMKKGFSYDEAKAIVDNEFILQKEKIKNEKENISKDLEELNRQKNLLEGKNDDIKKIWRKLVNQYHPDLQTSNEEKEKCEIIMKKINKAYRNNDLASLYSIDDLSFKYKDNDSINFVKTQIDKIQELINDLRKQYQKLQKTKWYVWKIKLEKVNLEGRDLFGELTKTLEDSITQKEELLNKEIAEL